MNLAGSAALQARSIYALILRRIRTQYAGSRAGYAWAIIEPVVWVFVLKMAIRGGGAGVPPVGTSYEVFFATGIVIARTWRTAAGQMSAVMTRNKRERLPTLYRMDTMYSIWILEMLTGGIALACVLGLLAAFGYDAMPYDIMLCIAAFFVCAIYTLAFALVFALLLVIAPGMSHFKGIILLIGFMTSGFSFVVDRMPPNIRSVVTWNPLLHVIELFREGFYRGYECRSLALVYLFVAIVMSLIIGLAGERALRRHNTKETVVGGEDETSYI